MFADGVNNSCTTFEQARQRPGARMALIGGTGNSASLKKFTKYISFRKVAGEDIADSNYEALTTADPAYKIYLHLYTQNAADGTSNIDVKIYTYFRFYCSYFDKQLVSES